MADEPAKIRQLKSLISQHFEASSLSFMKKDAMEDLCVDYREDIQRTVKALHQHAKTSKQLERNVCTCFFKTNGIEV